MRPARLLLIVSAILALALPAAANKPRRPSGSTGMETSFIFMRDADSTIMSGSLSDLKRIKKVLDKGERLLWFRTADGKEFIVRDPATLSQFEAVWKVSDALAHKQGEIGNKQGIIGARQGAVGAKQGVIGVRQGVIGNKQAALEGEDDSTPAAREAIAKKRRALEAEMRELEQKMHVLEGEMRELQKPMRELQREMEVVSKQHQAAAKQAEVASEALMARAITSGVAKPF